MTRQPTCTLCGGATEEGFLLDRGESNYRQQQEWWQGAPERSFWCGMKKPDMVLKTKSFRCVKCGYLMLFAANQESGQP